MIRITVESDQRHDSRQRVTALIAVLLKKMIPGISIAVEAYEQERYNAVEANVIREQYVTLLQTVNRNYDPGSEIELFTEEEVETTIGSIEIATKSESLDEDKDGEYETVARTFKQGMEDAADELGENFSRISDDYLIEAYMAGRALQCRKLNLNPDR